MKAQTGTVDREEVEKFSQMADAWWDKDGDVAPLHRINALRAGWIESQVTSHFSVSSLAGLSLLDIGCGGGLVCEPMARLGASVMGIDASEKNIAVAKAHAAESQLPIDYRCAAAEALDAPPFDVVLALEIIEHVADIPAFVEAVCRLVKPGGLVVFSTINRTAKAFALAIVGAEYVLRMLPRGTHDWNKFVKPSELARELRANGVEIKEMTGMVMNPFAWKWELNPKDVDVNYLLAGAKA